MPKYIRSVEAAEKISEKAGIPIHELVDVFADIPAADMKEAVHGKWVPQLHYPGTYAKCSICGCRCGGYTPNYKYCPNCGAFMDGGETQ